MIRRIAILFMLLSTVLRRLRNAGSCFTVPTIGYVASPFAIIENAIGEAPKCASVLLTRCSKVVEILRRSRKSQVDSSNFGVDFISVWHVNHQKRAPCGDSA